jgi:serine/threonine protein kinase
VARDVAYAMNFLHHRGFIHRDLKPDNVLLTENGRAKVCDLGFARAASRTSAYMTMAGSVSLLPPPLVHQRSSKQTGGIHGTGDPLVREIR